MTDQVQHDQTLKFKPARLRQGVKLRKLSQETGLSADSIREIEESEVWDQMPFAAVIKLGAALGFSTSGLLGMVESKPGGISTLNNPLSEPLPGVSRLLWFLTEGDSAKHGLEATTQVLGMTIGEMKQKLDILNHVLSPLGVQAIASSEGICLNFDFEVDHIDQIKTGLGADVDDLKVVVTMKKIVNGHAQGTARNALDPDALEQLLAEKVVVLDEDRVHLADRTICLLDLDTATLAAIRTSRLRDPTLTRPPRVEG